MTTSTPTPRAGLRQGNRTFRAIPVRLRGDEASLVVSDVPAEGGDVRLVLDWTCGAVTELSVRIRSIEARTRLAHLDIRGVGGDWQPFLAYLGEHAA